MFFPEYEWAGMAILGIRWGGPLRVSGPTERSPAFTIPCGSLRMARFSFTLFANGFWSGIGDEVPREVVGTAYGFATACQVCQTCRGLEL